MSDSTMSVNSFSERAILCMTVAWHEENLIDFLARFTTFPKMYMENDSATVSFTGAGIVARIEASGEDRFTQIRKKSEQLFSRIKQVDESEIDLSPKLIGGFSFSPNSARRGLWENFPDAVFVLPEYMLTRSDNKLYLSVYRVLPSGADEDECISHMRADMERLRLPISKQNGKTSLGDSVSDNEIDNLLTQDDWEDMVSNAVDRIGQGDLQKVVLARVCKVKKSKPINISRSLDLLAKNFPGCYRFWLEFNPGHVFLGATPEGLTKLQNNQFDTIALAGSIVRGNSAKEDDYYAKLLLESAKDLHEHRLVVDDLKIRLSQFVDKLEIQDQPYVSKLRNIQHLRTDIRGTIKRGTDILDLVEEIHPTAALGGIPRGAALHLIKELEEQGRGWYGAPIGWFDSNGEGEFVVAIRSGVVSGNEAWLYSGAGIVANSNPIKEWEESQIKLKPMLDALVAS